MSEPTGYGPDYYKSESELRAELAAKDARIAFMMGHGIVQDNAALRKELAAMTERAEKAEDTIGDQTDLERDLADAKVALEAANVREKDITARWHEEREHTSNVEGEAATLRASIADLQGALEAANANISDLRRKVSDHEKYIADLEEACNNLRTESDQESGDAVDAENALEAAKAVLAETKAALDKLQKAYDESHNENRDLLQFIERMEQEIDHA